MKPPRPRSPPRAVAAAALLWLLAGPTGPTGTARAGEDGEWPQYAHDAALTGRTPLRGDIHEPRVAWSLSLSGTQVDLELHPAAGEHTAELPGPAAAPLARRQVEIPGPAARDIDGTGTLRPALETYHERWAKVLPGVQGLQRTRWDQTWTTAKICHLELYGHDQGHDRPRRLWRSEPEDTVFMPLCVVCDLDRDGTQEICVALHYRVMVYEATTGRKESELRFHSSRSYGWFGVADVDADGLLELIVLADFQSHLGVVDCDPEKRESERLSLKWRRDIEQAIERRAKWPQIGPRPLADLTGDGTPEIVINLFNDSGDGEWHVAVLEAATGKVLADLPQRYTHGNADTDGDGRAEIFCAATRGVLVPDFGRIEIVGLAGSEASATPSLEWSHAGAGFAVADWPRLGPTWSTGATSGMRHVLLSSEGPRPAFLVRSRASPRGSASPGGAQRTGLAAWRHDGRESLRELWRAEGLPEAVEAAALEEDGGSARALARLRFPLGAQVALACRGVRTAVVRHEPLGTAPFPPVAARLEAGGPVHVAVEGAADMVFAVRPSRGAGDAAQVAWQRPGRGMADGTRPGGLLAADLDGDGGREVVAAGRTPSGAAQLVAYRSGGEVLWRRAFETTPGARPVHNAGALTFWWPGRFRSPGGIDLFVNTRRGLMHSDEGHLLDGRTGETVWTRREADVPGKFHWGYAGVPLAVTDVAGDGREELVNLYPVCFWIAEGTSGRITAGVDLAARQMVPAWAAYGEPLVHDFTGDGVKDVLLDSVYILALLDREGRALWHGKARRDYPTGRADDNFGETTAVKHALIDLDGDGRFEIASAGYGDGVRAIDPRDGRILWVLAAPAATGHKCAAADVDGRPGDELLYVAGSELVAVTGDRGAGRVLWTWTAPAPLSLPAVADLDGDGRAEIALQAATGEVYCLDGAP